MPIPFWMIWFRHLAFFSDIRASKYRTAVETEAILIDLKAIAFAGVLFVLALIDYFVNGGAVFVFLGKKLFDLIALIEFWR